MLVSSIHSRIAACSIVSSGSTFPPGPAGRGEKEKRKDKGKGRSEENKRGRREMERRTRVSKGTTVLVIISM